MIQSRGISNFPWLWRWGRGKDFVTRSQKRETVTRGTLTVVVLEMAAVEVVLVVMLLLTVVTADDISLPARVNRVQLVPQQKRSNRMAGDSRRPSSIEFFVSLSRNGGKRVGFGGTDENCVSGSDLRGGGGKSRGNRAIKPASRLESNGEEGKRIVYGISAKLRGVYTNRHHRRTCALAVFPQPTAGGRRPITDACVPRCPATTRRRYARHRRRRLRHSRRRRYNNLLPVYGYYDRDDRCDTDCNTRDTNNDYTVTTIQSDNDRGNGRKKTATPFACRPHRVHRCIYIMYILYLPRWSWSGPG